MGTFCETFALVAGDESNVDRSQPIRRLDVLFHLLATSLGDSSDIVVVQPRSVADHDI